MDETKQPGRPSRDLIRQTFYLTAEQVAWLKAEQERTGAPVSEIIRRAIDAYRGQGR